jgi:AcrR family transcriptional regulator
MAKRIPAAERRRQIAAAAGVLFADRGVQATTVRDIADRVGMLSGSLYHHFKTKHDIVHELMRDYGEELLSRYRAAATATEDGNSAEILIHEQSKLFALDEFDYVNRVVEEVEAIFVRVIVEGMNRGEVRTDIAPAFTYRMMMDVMGAVQRWYDPGKHSEDLVVQAWLDVFLRGIAPR